MIFLTVGHQMPFDRLVRAVDEWAAAETGRGGTACAEIVAQIGTGGRYRPRSFAGAAHFAPRDFAQTLERAEAVVAHAGMGTIIAALRLGKPVLVLPRRAEFGETRNDHQVDTARHFAAAGYVLAAYDEADLPQCLAELAAFRPRVTLGASASPQLIARLRAFASAA